MTWREDAGERLISALRALRAYLPHLVLCGGWTLHVYRRWVVGEGPDPLFTTDVDLATRASLPGEEKPLEQYLHEAGYRSEMTGLRHDPPIVRFTHSTDPELEFITPITGDVTPHTVEVQEGVVAQSLRFVELLLEAPMTVRLAPEDIVLRVASPEAYFMQKALSFPRRGRREDRSKDLAYLFDLLHNFSQLADGLEQRVWSLARTRSEWTRWYDTMRENLRQYFADLDGEGVELVLRQKPHPFAVYVEESRREGEEEFRGLVYRTFDNTLQKLSRVPLGS